MEATSKWGTYLWGYIHTICWIDFKMLTDFEKRKIDHVVGILRRLGDVLYCPTCTDFYNHTALPLLDQCPVYEPMALFRWSVTLHNLVNAKLNKPAFSYEAALQKWRA